MTRWNPLSSGRTNQTLIRCTLATALVSATCTPWSAGLQACAQAPANIGIADTWQGTLQAGHDLRTVLKITKAPDGSLKSTFYSIDQGGEPIPVKSTTFVNGELKLIIEVLDGEFTGKLSPDGTTIKGDWQQGNHTLPLTLARATPETAWRIPEPPPKIVPMKADADPTFEVATIKPAKPDSQGKGFGGPPGRFMTRNTTLDDLLMFAYDLHTKQILGGPDLGRESSAGHNWNCAWDRKVRHRSQAGHPRAPPAKSKTVA